MPLPSDWDTVEIHGRYVDVNGNPAIGTITFTAQTRLRSDATETAVLPSTISISLDDEGAFTYNLPVTDDPDIAPSGWAWLVTEKFGPDTAPTYRRNFLMLAPAGDPIDLTNIAPAVPPEDAPVVPWVSVAGKRPNAEGDIVLAYGDLEGVVPIEALPAITVTDVYAVADEAAMLTLDAQQGDMAIRADENSTYVLGGDEPSDAADWIRLATPPDVVLSVAGKTGAVTLTRDDVGLDYVDNTADADKPVSTATQTALNGKVPTSRTITAGTGLSGGGDLTANRTLTVSYGATSGTAAAGNDSRITGAAQTGNNLSDLANATTARSNLGLGNAATRNVGTASGTVAAGDDTRVTGAAQKASNLADLASAATARTNLGLGEAATRPVGTTAGSVAAGDDPRFTSGGSGGGTTSLPVANGTHFNGNGGAGVEGLVQARCRQTRKLLRVIDGGSTRLRLEWANIYTTVMPKAGDATCENPGPNNVAVRMSVEVPAGVPRVTNGSVEWSSSTSYVPGDQLTYNGTTYVVVRAVSGVAPGSDTSYRRVRRYPVLWDGSDANGTITFAPGDYKTSRDVQLDEPLRYGDKIAVYGAFDSGSTTGRIPYAGANGAAKHGEFTDWVIDSTSGMPSYGQSIVDTGLTTQANGNTTTANEPNASQWMKLPYATAITGDAPAGEPCIALFGDSIMAGYYDYRDGEPCGALVRALDGARWWRIAQGGNRAGAYVGANAPWQMSVVKRCTAVVTDMGLNDMQDGQSAQVVRRRMETLWRTLGAQGPPVYATLLTPISTSTDSWTTVGNQGQYTGGGTINTTQFPGGSTAYASSVWGSVQQWLSHEGAPVVTTNGRTVLAGEHEHPLAGIIDDRSMLADVSTGWRWNAGFTTDGAHPTPTAAVMQGAYMGPDMDDVLTGAHRTVRLKSFDPAGRGPVVPFERSVANTESQYITSGSVMSVLDVSPGRYFYGMRAYCGSKTDGSRAWSLLVGMDPARMRVWASGSTTPSGGRVDTALPNGPLWIPRGYLVAVQLATPAANALIGGFPTNAAIHISGLSCTLAAHVPGDTSALTVGSVVSLADSSVGGTKYTAARFRAYAELY